MHGTPCSDYFGGLVFGRRELSERGWVSAGVKTTTHAQILTVRRTLLLVGAVVALSGLASPTLRASQRWETLEAIHWIENPHDTTRPGPCGELGAYQFREATWRMHTAVPFARAIERPVSDAVAVKHYEWLKQGLVRHGLEASPYNIALAWNGGLAATVRGSVRPCTRDYAERVTNIAQSLHATQLANNR